MTLEPETGSDISVIEVTTSAGCPTTADSYNVIVTGPNGFNIPIVSTTDVGISLDSPFSALFGLTMKLAPEQQRIPLVTGEYDVDLRCVEGFINTSKGNFTTAMFFTVTPTSATYTTPTIPTPSPSPTPTPRVSLTPTPSPTATPTPAPIATKTKLTVPIQIKIGGLGILVVADARVTAENDCKPVGTVQFKDGDTNVGNPVPMTDGHAFSLRSG